MKQSVLQLYRKEIIFFYILFALLMGAASVWDLQIDTILNNTSSVVAVWFDKTGEMPASLLITAAAGFIVRCSEKIWVKIPGSVAVLAAGGYFGMWFGERLFTDNEFQLPFSIIFGIGFGAAVLFTLHFVAIPESAKKPLTVIAVLGLCAAGLETLTVSGMKALWGRVRFRELDGNFSQFTPWYVINGCTGSHSFPSGHTGSAGMSFLVMLLPSVSEKCRKYKSALFFTAFFYTSVVAFTRLVMGAHYLSDVAFGGMISFTCTVAAAAVYEKVLTKKLKLQ